VYDFPSSFSPINFSNYARILSFYFFFSFSFGLGYDGVGFWWVPHPKMILCIIDDLSSSIQLDILFLFYFLSAHSLAFFFSFFFLVYWFFPL